MAVTVWLSPPLDVPLPQRPFLSCIDGHIVASLSECPPIPNHQHDNPPPIGGGPGRRGLLGLGIGGIL